MQGALRCEAPMCRCGREKMADLLRLTLIVTSLLSVGACGRIGYEYRSLVDAGIRDGEPEGGSTDNDACANGPCGCDISQLDRDQDGTADCEDGCATDPGKTAPGLCGCGVKDTDDSDGDLVPDCLDSADTDSTRCSDTDGDGCDDCTSGALAPENDGEDSNGDGVCEQLSLSAKTVDFGTLEADVENSVPIVVYNESGRRLTGCLVSLVGSNRFTGEPRSCTTLEVGQSCVVVVTATAQAGDEGIFRATLRVTCDGDVSTSSDESGLTFRASAL